MIDDTSLKDESVIDFPKAEGLCSEVWDKAVSPIDGISEVYVLKPDVKDKVLKLADAVSQKAQVNGGVIVHITGSITSNSYTSNADVDVHILSRQVLDEDPEAIQKRVVQAVKELKEALPHDDFYVGTHPIELYYQPNFFQDLMSVGCYDVIKQRWEVGPEMTDPSFDPYSDYYKDIQNHAASLLKDIRDSILSIYEQAVALKKMQDGGKTETSTYSSTMMLLLKAIDSGTKLFDKIRQSRKVYSSPTSKEEALQFRSSRKWKIADATFKLIDKFGYTKIFKELKQLVEDISANENVLLLDELPFSIIQIVKDSIGNPEKLSEEDTGDLEEAVVDEGVMKNIALAALLAVPGIVDAKDVQNSLDKADSQYEQTVQNVNSRVRMVGRYSAFQAANIIARTIYAEARSEGEEGMRAVASVIYNRAKGKDSDFALVCIKPWQFSCWNGLTVKHADQLAPKAFKIKIPASAKNGSSQGSWKTAMKIAGEMLSGSFTPTTSATFYYVTDMKKPPKWKKQLKDVMKIGKHTFGTLKSHSAFI